MPKPETQSWTAVEEALIDALRDLPINCTQAEILAAGGPHRTEAQVRRKRQANRTNITPTLGALGTHHDSIVELTDSLHARIDALNHARKHLTEQIHHTLRNEHPAVLDHAPDRIEGTRED